MVDMKLQQAAQLAQARAQQAAKNMMSQRRIIGTQKIPSQLIGHNAHDVVSQEQVEAYKNAMQQQMYMRPYVLANGAPYNLGVRPVSIG